MQLGGEVAGRYSPNALASSSLLSSPRPDSHSTFGEHDAPRLASLAPSPRLETVPRFPHQRKDSTTSPASAFAPPLQTGISGVWTRLFGVRAAGASLPSHRRRFSNASRRLVSPRDAAPVGGSLVRRILRRLFYPHGPRSLLVPTLSGITILLLFLLLFQSPSSQSTKLRVQHAMEPYIPVRAADGMRWQGRRHGVPGHWEGTPRQAGSMGKGQAWHKVRPTLLALPPARADGRTVIVEGKTHPIPALMERAKRKWEDLKNRQSHTFSEAVDEYVRRYKRRPPKGFDKWYAFARANRVLLIDEFDLIDKDLKMFRAFTPASIRKRVEHLLKTFDKTWTLRISHGEAFREGELGDHDRAVGVVKLIKRFVHCLPDLKMAYNGHDGARIGVVWEERKRLEALVDAEKYDDTDKGPPFRPFEKGPAPHWGMSTFCPAGSAVREPGFEYGFPEKDSTGLEMPPQVPGSVGTVIESFTGYMNVCNSPQYRHFHATTSWVYSQQPPPVMPLFTPGVQTTFGDIYTIIVEQHELQPQHDFQWSERPFTSLQWRGQTSGPLWERSTPWKTTQRARLHLLSHSEEGTRKIIVTDENDIAHVKEVDALVVNPIFLDTGMVGPAVQCVKEDGTCDTMEKVFKGYDTRISLDRSALYKYVLDVDGNSWSGRFRRLMLSNAAVIKATIFPEFWTDWAIPWLHFIPMQVDYSDMWDIMAFFRGGVHGEGAHDELGKEIADAGKEWANECYRWADLEAYQFRLMLEYGRLYNDDLEDGGNDFNGDDSQEPVWIGVDE